MKDYSETDHFRVEEDIKRYMVTFTQKQAGFTNQPQDEFLRVQMSPKTKKIFEAVKKDKVLQGRSGLILGDQPAKLLTKLHQIASGSVIAQDPDDEEKRIPIVLDWAKIEAIKDKFDKGRLAIFYVYNQEGEMLKESFDWTDSPEEFSENPDKVFIGQVRACREGINLSCADHLIFYNIEFSSLSYIQGRDRMTSKERTKPNIVYFLFSDLGIEEKIYKTVQQKQEYTTRHFKKDFLGQEKQSKLF